MARFYLIDHSLVDRGGHHFDYTTCVVNAAKEIGFETVVAANKRVSADIEFNGTPPLPVFESTVYQRESALAGLRHLKRVKPASADGSTSNGWARTKALFQMHRLARRRVRSIDRFASNCQKLFDDHPVADGDHVFLTTVSELELLALSRYLHSNPSSILASWHLQFHFNVFDGRPPEYDSQKETETTIREAFETALAGLNNHRVFFYTSSQPLAHQYNRLQVGQFHSLPYPIAPQFSNRTTVDESSEGFEETVTEPTTPLRFTCPGQLRREKGVGAHLQPLVDELWASHLATGKIKIAVQRPRKKFLRKQKISLTTPVRVPTDAAKDVALNVNANAAASPIDSSAAADNRAAAFEYHRHPLSRPEYIDLVRNTDCGLLLYDSRVYYSRRAGVLGELLACGKPLIVPAGCWLADQIAEPIFQYADDLCSDRAQNCRELGIDALEWCRGNAPATGGVISFDGQRHPFLFSLNRQPDECLLKIDFQWHWPKENGTYCAIETVEKDGTGKEIRTTKQIIGHRMAAGTPNALFRIQPETETVNVKISNAYEESTAMIRGLKATLIVVGDREMQHGGADGSTKHSPTHSFVSSIDSGSATTSDGLSPGSSGERSVRNAITVNAEEKQSSRVSSQQRISDAPVSIPLGSVGIIVSDPTAVAEAVREIYDHFSYYRSTAENFSVQWGARHRPNRTVAHLIRSAARDED